MTAPTALARSRVDHPQLRDEQLDDLRGLLEQARAEQRRQYDHSEALFEVILDGSGGDETGADRELARASADHARDALDEIDGALRRLEAGTYGACEWCGRAIPFERLEAIPQARFCVACPRSAVFR